MLERIEEALIEAGRVAPSREASLVKTKLEEALLWEEKRLRDVGLLEHRRVNLEDLERAAGALAQGPYRRGL